MPGVICIENITLFTILFLIIIGVMIYLYYNHINIKKDVPPSNTGLAEYPRNSIMNYNGREYSREREPQRETKINIYENRDIYQSRFPFGFSERENDVLLNPYSAPLKDDRYFPSNSGDPRGIPINIATRAVDTTYRQVGILTRLNGDETILPLMGRPLFTNRDKWNFYTMSDKNNMIKLPVSFKGKSCTNEYGCDNIYNGDTVYVEGYNTPFKVTMYDNNTMKYIPYI